SLIVIIGGVVLAALGYLGRQIQKTVAGTAKIAGMEQNSNANAVNLAQLTLESDANTAQLKTNSDELATLAGHVKAHIESDDSRWKVVEEFVRAISTSQMDEADVRLETAAELAHTVKDTAIVRS